MPMVVEAALITKKAAQAEYNTDSVNASGKTWSREAVHGEKGIRAVGTGRDIPYYVLASSEAKGTAESAADLFKSCTDIFEKDMSNCSEVISDFYSSFAKVLNEAGYKSSDCDLSVFCGYGSEVFLAKSGNAKLYSYIDNNFSEAVPQLFDFSDAASSFGVCNFKNVKTDDIFILLNSCVASVLPDGLLKAICTSAEGDTKKLAAIISAQAEKYGCKGAVSAIILKIKEADIPPAAIENDAVNTDDFTPVEQATEAAADVAAAMTDTKITDENTGNNEGKKTKKGKVGFIIVLVIFFALLAILGFLMGKGIASRHKVDESASISETENMSSNEETSVSEITTEETSATEKTSEITSADTSSASEKTTVKTTAKETTTRSNVVSKPATTVAGTTEKPTEKKVESVTTLPPATETTTEEETDASTDVSTDVSTESSSTDTSKQDNTTESTASQDETVSVTEVTNTEATENSSAAADN